MSPARRRTVLLRLASLWPMWVIAIVSLWLREFYPLSRFPMYANFTNETHFVFLTDEDGEPVTDMLHQFGQTTNRLHKMHTTKVEKLRDSPEGEGLSKPERMRAVTTDLLEQMIVFQEQRWSRRQDHSGRRDFERLDLWVEYLRYDPRGDDHGPRIQRERKHLGSWPADTAGTRPPPLSDRVPAMPDAKPQSTEEEAP